MNVLFVSAEVTPFSKAGGLADVAGSLPAALSPYVSSIQVITPLYGQIDKEKHQIISAAITGTIILGDETLPYSLFKIENVDNSFQTWFIQSDQFFERNGLYTKSNGVGFEDNNLRYFFFQLVVLDLLKKKYFEIDVLHCNDHHTGLLPVLVNNAGMTIRTIYTIHNFLYHGHFSQDEMKLLPLPIRSQLTKTQWDNYSALLEGIDHADQVTTVSPGYARELLDGLNLDEHSHKHVFAAESKLSGIINGIDTEYWNPGKDKYTPFHFSAKDLDGKQLNKRELLRQTDLDDDIEAPLLGSISRLVENKGFPLIVELLDELVEMGAKLIFLGSGDPAIAQQLREASLRHPGRITFDDGFNEPLAHLIEAGSDMFLMPSRFEPCGLNQLYSLRYGTIPIVHHTGGLGDTVVDWNAGRGTGFVFRRYNVEHLKDALKRSLKIFKDKRSWSELLKRAMAQDFSWDRSALNYFKLYKK
ncbi:MAG: glycogen/starch synthase [Candidatus Marinimicrobia bacterium]|nr:glycogen/starch synthase [Candidatus Neomarinimicrobiota bacterium]